MSKEGQNSTLTDEDIERIVAAAAAVLQKQKKHYVRVMKAQGDARASVYMKEGWDIFSAHVYERVESRNNQGHPTKVILETVYIMVEPEGHLGVSIPILGPDVVVASPQPAEGEGPPENVVEKRGPGRPPKDEKVLV